MISILLWKEYREQRAVWLVLAALAAGVLIGLPIIFAADFDHPSVREILPAIGVLLAWTYGMVCGAMLLAGERESGTQGFLDTLPVTRLGLWWGKGLAGLLLALAHSLALFGMMMVKPLVEPGEWVALLGLLLLGGALGLGWGLLLSAHARTVLGAIGMSIVVQWVGLSFIWVVSLGVVSLVCSLLDIGPPHPTALVSTGLVALALPLSMSARDYCRRDRIRRLASNEDKGFLAQLRRPYKAAVWLSTRQMRGLAMLLPVISMGGGLVVLLDPLLIWPAATLTVGTLCGVTVFLDEQAGPRRFLGDQRLPAWPVWNVKVGLRLALLLIALLVMLFPSLVYLLGDLGRHAQETNHDDDTILGRVFRSRLVGVTIPGDVFLFLPAAYGFTVGLLCGQLFRKAVVAIVAAGGLGVLLLSVWVPGLVAGGVPAWQVSVVPLLLLASSRWLMLPWVADRLASARVVLGLTCLVALCLLASGLGIWYRVASVPQSPEPPELAQFLSRLPDPDHNQTGQLIRSTLSTIDTRYREWNRERPKEPLFPEEPVVSPHELYYSSQAQEVVFQGWPDRPLDQIELAGWLDQVFADEVWKSLDPLPGLPLGLVEDPRRMDLSMNYRSFDQFRNACALLLARGLQMQKKGDPSVFVHNLNITLALVRNMKNGAPTLGDLITRGGETQALLALETWLRALSDHTELLGRCGDILDRHRAQLPDSDMDHKLAEYLIGRNSLDRPSSWIKENLVPGRAAQDMANQEENVLTFVWQIPWERERQQRLLRAEFFAPAGAMPSRPPPYHHLAVPMPWSYFADRKWDERRRSQVAHREAARLMVALRHFQATTGKPAPSLAQLVPGSMAAIPLDPFDGQPFRYRLSAGETISGPQEEGREATQKVLPRQGILWSVGPDGVDDGGRDKAKDQVYVVPQPKGK